MVQLPLTTRWIQAIANGDVSMDSDDDITVGANINSGTGTLTIDAGGALSIGADITSGSIDFDSTNNFTLNNSYTLNTSASNGAIDIDSNDNLTINGTINTGTGTVTLDGQDSISLVQVPPLIQVLKRLPVMVDYH